MDPIEGKDGLPLNRVSVDNQTDISSSNYAAGVNDAIAKGDEKLGQEINEINRGIKDQFEEVNDTIGANKEAIDNVAKAGEEARKDLADTILFNAGDEGDDLTSERLQELITEFKTEMEENIATVKSEESSEKEVRIATFWLSQFGEVYTPLGFNLWQLKDFSSVEDDLDSATMEEYEQVIEELRSNILKFKSVIAKFDAKEEAGEELSPEEKDMRKEAQREVKSLEGNFIRWTDPNDATPDVVEDRVTTLEKGLQWRFDGDDNAMDAFREELMSRIIGVSGAGEYYKEMTERFKAAAEDAKATIEEYEAREEAEEPHSQEQELAKAKADYFVAKFGTIDSVVAITSFEDYNDSYNSVQWDEETYNEYLNEVSELVSIKGKLEADLAQAEKEGNEEHAAKLKEELNNISSRLTSYTCNSGLNPYLECLDGYVNWYVTRHDSEFDAFQDNLTRNVLGTTSAGEYYKEMTERFKSEAENAKATIEEYEAMAEAGEPITPEFEVSKAKADFFVNQFGAIASIVAIKAYEDYRDAFNAVQWDEETYNDYISEVTNLTDVKGKLEADLAQAEKEGNEEHAAKLKEELKDVSDKIRSYTCENGVDGDVVCLDGYVAWYVYTHDTEFKRYIDEATEENGFNPSAQIPYLESKKEEFKSEMENALDIISYSEEEGNDVSEKDLSDAQDFVGRFGKVSNAQSSFHNWLAYKAEGRVSEVAGEMFRIIECVTNNLIDGVNEIVTTSTEVAASYPLPDGETKQFNLFGVPSNYEVKQVFINGIAAVFTQENDSIAFGVAPHAGASLTILIEVSSTQRIGSISIDRVCGIDLPEEVRGYDSYDCDGLIREMGRVQSRLEVENTSLSESKNSKADSETTKADLSGLETKLAEDRKKNEDGLAAEQDKKSAAEAESNKVSDELSDAQSLLSDVNTKVAENRSELAQEETKLESNKVQLQIAKIEKSVEEARPFPDEDKIADLQTQIDNLEKAIEEAKTTIEDLKAEITKGEDQANDLTATVNDKTADLAKVEAQIAEHASNIVTISSILKITMSNILLVGDKLKTVDETIEKLEEVIKEHEDGVAKLTKELEDRKAEIDEKGCEPGGPMA